MPGTSYSKAILKGMRTRGLSDTEILKITGISPKVLGLITAGKRELSTAVVRKIENATGRTGGQLAALAVEPNGGPFTKLMDGWAKVRVAASASSARRTRSKGIVSGRIKARTTD